MKVSMVMKFGFRIDIGWARLTQQNQSYLAYGFLSIAYIVRLRTRKIVSYV